MSESNDGGFVELHDDFPHLMAGPHRRRVTPVGAPALTRHLVFWKPLDWANYDDNKRPSRVRSRAIDDAIAEIYRTLLALRRSGVAHNLDTNGKILKLGSNMIVMFDSFMRPENGAIVAKEADERKTGADAHRTVKLMFDWRGIPGTIAFENHVEFVTAMTILDLSCHVPHDRLSRLRADRLSVFSKAYDHLETIANEQLGDPDKCALAHGYLYREVWKQFEREVLIGLRKHKNSLGKAVADFRGLVIGVNYDLRERGARAKCQRTIAMPCTRPQKRPAMTITSVPRPKWLLTDFNSIWKLLNCGVNEEDTELTASEFLCGRAFYATALGEQSGVEVKPNPHPLYYLIFEDTANIWQLGRLVYRINFAGTFRVVATMHFERLREVGGSLLQAGIHLDRALSRAAPKDQGGEESIKQARQQVRDDYELVEAPLADLTQIDVDGPIYDRIERSRHYVDQFRHTAKALRIKRIDGFQPYDEFVFQKVGPAFEYIDRLGRRYVQIQRDRSLLFRRLQALDALYEERVISKIQYAGDVALLCVLGPYYVGSLATHVVQDDTIDHYIWVSVVLFGIGRFITTSLARRYPRAKAWRSALMRAMFVFPIMAMFWLMAYFGLIPTWLSGPPPAPSGTQAATQESTGQPPPPKAARH